MGGCAGSEKKGRQEPLKVDPVNTVPPQTHGEEPQVQANRQEAQPEALRQPDPVNQPVHEPVHQPQVQQDYPQVVEQREQPATAQIRPTQNEGEVGGGISQIHLPAQSQNSRYRQGGYEEQEVPEQNVLTFKNEILPMNFSLTVG